MGGTPYTDVKLTLLSRNTIAQRVRHMYLRRLDLALKTQENYYFAYPHQSLADELKVEKKTHEQLFDQMQANCEKAFKLGIIPRRGTRHH